MRLDGAVHPAFINVKPKVEAAAGEAASRPSAMARASKLLPFRRKKGPAKGLFRNQIAWRPTLRVRHDKQISSRDTDRP